MLSVVQKRTRFSKLTYRPTPVKIKQEISRLYLKTSEIYS